MHAHHDGNKTWILDFFASLFLTISVFSSISSSIVVDIVVRPQTSLILLPSTLWPPTQLPPASLLLILSPFVLLPPTLSTPAPLLPIFHFFIHCLELHHLCLLCCLAFHSLLLVDPKVPSVDDERLEGSTISNWWESGRFQALPLKWRLVVFLWPPWSLKSKAILDSSFWVHWHSWLLINEHQQKLKDTSLGFILGMAMGDSLVFPW